jgi:serine phosphatase RsbU (regulator of sigma subunit)
MEGIRFAAQLIAVGLAASATYELVRWRTRERLELALFFIAFASAEFFTFDLTGWPLLVVFAGTVGVPFLLLRLADHFRPVPALVQRLALAGLIFTQALNIWMLVVVDRLQGSVLTMPAPDRWAALTQTVYIAGSTGFATWIFITTAIATSGVTAWRARLAALGSVVLVLGNVATTVIVLQSISETGVPQPPVQAQEAFYVAIAVGAVCNFAAFATPPWGRQLWQLGELHRFLRLTAGTSVGEQRAGSLSALTTAAERATGGTATVLAADAVPVTDKKTVSVPVETRERRLGWLSVRFRTSPLFPADDAAILKLMADQTAIALANDELFRQRRELEQRERGRVQAELDRVAEELAVARNIQLSLLPTSTPDLPGWRITSFYRPARSVGGDLYDFFTLPDGSQAIVIGDASGDGIPAALLMATARSVIRSVGAFTSSPGEILARANVNMVGGIPPNTFVTCMIVALDTATGRARYANAGHDVAYAELGGVPRELRARGMPLGALPGMTYEELETTIRPSEMLVLYTDGIVEAHDPKRQLFSFQRLRDIVASASDDPTPLVLSALESFTGPGWEQEDDITMVSVRRVMGTP